MLERTWREGNPSALLVGMQTGAASVGNMRFPKKTKKDEVFSHWFLETEILWQQYWFTILIIDKNLNH